MIDLSMLHPGDKVKIVDAWIDDSQTSRQNHEGRMDKWLGCEMTVHSVKQSHLGEYYVTMVEDFNDRQHDMGWNWFAEMIDGFADDDLEACDEDMLSAILC